MDKESFALHNKENLAKTRYFSDFALKHFSEMKILKKGGILGKENKDWRNISEHCLAEAVSADILAEYLGANREAVTTATLIHDWYKRREIEAMKKMGEASGYKQTIKEDENLLRKFGINDEIIKLSHSNIPENANFEYLKNRSIEEKIIHFVDMIMKGSELINFTERLDALDREGKYVDFFESFREKYGGKNLNELQREVSAMEQEEFEKILKIKPGTLIDFIKEKLEERIKIYE